MTSGSERLSRLQNYEKEQRTRIDRSRCCCRKRPSTDQSGNGSGKDGNRKRISVMFEERK